MKPTFFSSFLVLGPTSDDFSGNLSHLSLRTPLFALREGFSDSAFSFLHPLLHLPISIDFLSLPHPPLPSPLPHFLSLSSPLFHSPPQLTHDRAHPRASRTYAYERTHLHVRRFSFIAFTASPTPHNPLCINTLGVKENKQKPSQNKQRTHYQRINNKFPISSAVNPIYRRGEPKKTKAFTPYALCHKHLRHTGEGVKTKNENRLTRARTREGKREGNWERKGAPHTRPH